MDKLKVQKSTRFKQMCRNIAEHIRDHYRKPGHPRYTDYYPVKRSPDKTILYPEEIKANAIDAQLRRYNGGLSFHIHQ